MEAYWSGIEKRLFGLVGPLVNVFARLGISPIVFTMGGVVVSLLTLFLLAKGFLVWGGLTIIVIVFFDVFDGQLARKTGTATKTGAFLDSTMDRLAEGFIFLGLLIHFYGKSLVVVVLILLALISSFLVSYVRARAEGLGVPCTGGTMRRKRRLAILIVGTVFGSLQYTGDFVLGIAIGILAIMAILTAIYRIRLVCRILKKS